MPKPVAIEIRQVQPDDHFAVLALSPRLTVGVAPWRDPSKVALAVRGWLESSLATARELGHMVFVAVVSNEVVGVVTLSERRHFSGDVDAYVGELVTEWRAVVSARRCSPRPKFGPVIVVSPT